MFTYYDCVSTLNKLKINFNLIPEFLLVSSHLVSSGISNTIDVISNRLFLCEVRFLGGEVIKNNKKLGGVFRKSSKFSSFSSNYSKPGGGSVKPATLSPRNITDDQVNDLRIFEHTVIDCDENAII